MADAENIPPVSPQAASVKTMDANLVPRRTRLLQWKAHKKMEAAKIKNKGTKPPFVVSIRPAAMAVHNGPRRIPYAEAAQQATEADDDLVTGGAPASNSGRRSPSPRRNLEQVFQDEHKTSSLSDLIASMNFEDIMVSSACSPPSSQTPSAPVGLVVVTGGRPLMEKDAAYFRQQMSLQRDALQGLCAEWSGVTDNIEAAVCIGQAQLLLNQRFVQFDSLCNLYGTTANSTDLEGFWELIMIQVDKIRSAFDKLSMPAETEDTAAVEACLAPRKKRVKVDSGPAAPGNTSKTTPRRLAARQRLKDYKQNAAKRGSSLAMAVETVTTSALPRPTPRFKPRLSLDGSVDDRPILTPVRAGRKDREEWGTEFVLTSVRRSGRKTPSMFRRNAPPQDDLGALLQLTDFAYKPNEMLQMRTGPSHASPGE